MNRPKYIFVDICQPCDAMEQQIKEIQADGYVAVGQTDADCHSTLNFEDATRPDKEEVLARAEKRKQELKEYWDWHNTSPIFKN